jgi:hypothetical protein
VPHMNLTEFEALWEKVKNEPQVLKAETTVIQADLSLTGILNQYMAMVAKQRDQGKINQQDYNDLDGAVTALKAILVRINDSELVAEAMAQNAPALKQKTSGSAS